MLSITIPSTELFIEDTSEFLYTQECTIQLEHSLISLSKWEAKWKVPFLSNKQKTTEQLIDYIKCMTITQNVKNEIYIALLQYPLIIRTIKDYIDDSMTATWFSEKKPKAHSSEVVTAELIYYWMIAFQIPVEFQKWHLNRLLTLIRVCSAKNQPSKKMSKADVLKQNAELNRVRRKSHK